MSSKRDRLYRTEAIVLKRRDQGEADRVLTVFTPEKGKLQLLAKGVRKPTSRKAGHVELFTHSQFLVARGSTWGIVTQAETIHGYRPIREDLMRTGYAYYLAELVDRFTQEEDENRSVFDLLQSSLSWLAIAEDVPLLARFFELHLLGLVGYRPKLFQCVRCKEEIRPVENAWSTVEGGVLCPSCCGSAMGGVQDIAIHAEPLSLNALKVLRFLQTRDWDSCCRLRLGIPVHDSVERLLQRYIVYQLERNLKSVGFLHTVRAMGPPTGVEAHAD